MELSHAVSHEPIKVCLAEVGLFHTENHLPDTNKEAPYFTLCTKVTTTSWDARSHFHSYTLLNLPSSMIANSFGQLSRLFFMNSCEPAKIHSPYPYSIPQVHHLLQRYVTIHSRPHDSTHHKLTNLENQLPSSIP